MRSVWVWLILAVPAAWAVWQLQVPHPIVAPALLGLLLLALGLLAGVRLGFNGLERYLQEVTRLNRHLADQNNELAERNLCLLKEIRAYQAKEQDATDRGESD